MTDAFAAKQRVDQALEALRLGLGPYVGKHMKAKHGTHWRHYASRASGGDAQAELDSYALIKTILDNYGEIFRQDPRMRKARSYLSLALDARNATSHFDGLMQDREALRYLDAIRELLAAIEAKPQVKILDGLYKTQMQTSPEAASDAATAVEARLEEPPTPEQLRPWREVVQPHPDVLEARFTDAEFAANLAHVDQGLGSEEYTDPLAFFRITYLTEGLSRVLRSAALRLAKKAGDPVVGLQTNFGGGKTHTMLALYHLAGAVEAGYKPERLQGIKDILDAAGLTTLPSVQRAVFVGTHKGPSEVMHAGDGEAIRTVWGYIAYRLGGWDAVDLIRQSEAKRTNPGSEKLIRILEYAAPCLILLDEVVAFAKQLEGAEYEAFHAFIQSLTEAAAAVPGAMVVGSLPESKMEVGDARGVDALRRLEKLFGRVQSAWTPASGLETFEIVRRRLFQPLDDEGERARDATLQAYRKLYRDNAADFPPEARETAYRDEMRRAYPIHPTVLTHFSEDWSILEKFQRTRGVLKIMANAIYALWRGQSSAPLISLGVMPLAEEKVRTAILEPLDASYGPILQAEVDGELALPARLEATRKRFGGVIAATRAARTVFLATAPHRGSSRAGLTGPALRLACAQPGDQIAIFAEAVTQLAERSAYLYRERDRYWFSTQPTLNRLAEERANDVDPEAADVEIIRLLREEQSEKGGFKRLHAAPETLTDVEDSRALALVLLSPATPHVLKSAEPTAAERAITDTLQRCGNGQRRYRNALIFVAPNENSLDTCREIARKVLAWQSILGDEDLKQDLTHGQIADAEKREGQVRQGLIQRLRSTWCHVVYPVPPQNAGNGIGPAIGFELEHSSIVNRSPSKPIAPIVFDKLTGSTAILNQLGPDTLLTELRKVWSEDKPHIEVATLIDWFASYVYLPRLPNTMPLTGAVASLVTNLDSPVVIRRTFDESTGRYRDITEFQAGSESGIETALLVWRKDLPEWKNPDPSPSPIGETDKEREKNGGNIRLVLHPQPGIPKTTMVYSDNPGWKELVSRLEDLGVAEWEEEYFDPDILDGSCWQIALKTEDKEINARGCNAYPDNFDEAVDLIKEAAEAETETEIGLGEPAKPRRFYGSFPLDPDKAGLQVAKIAEEILFELGRPNDASLKLTLEIDASAANGYPDDVVDVVRSNLRDLKLDREEVGFEKE